MAPKLGASRNSAKSKYKSKFWPEGLTKVFFPSSLLIYFHEKTPKTFKIGIVLDNPG